MTEQLELHVANLDCDHDAATLRRGFQQALGVSDLQVLAKAARVRVTFDADATTARAIEERLRAIGFPPQPLLDHDISEFVVIGSGLRMLRA